MLLGKVSILNHDPSVIGTDADHSRISAHVTSPRSLVRRWRAALMRGDTSNEFSKRYFGPRPEVPWAGFLTASDAVVAGEGLIIVGDRLLCSESLMAPYQGVPNPHSILTMQRADESRWTVSGPDEIVHLQGLTATIVCDGWQIYGHWLLDVLPRLHRAMSSGQAIDHFVFPGPPKPWQLDMIKAVGFDIQRCRFIDFSKTSIRCDRLLVPTYDRFNSELRHEIVDVHRLIKQNVLGGVAPRATRKLFISRKETGSRQLANRERIERVAERMGYEVVRPEILSFADQVQLFASASCVFGECGSGLHSTLYSPERTQVGVIQSSTNVNFLQAQLAMWSNQDIFYVIGSAEREGDQFVVEEQDVAYAMSKMEPRA